MPPTISTLKEDIALKKHPRVFCATRRVIAKVDEIRCLSFVFSVFFVVNCFF